MNFSSFRLSTVYHLMILYKRNRLTTTSRQLRRLQIFVSASTPQYQSLRAKALQRIPLLVTRFLHGLTGYIFFGASIKNFQVVSGSFSLFQPFRGKCIDLMRETRGNSSASKRKKSCLQLESAVVTTHIHLISLLPGAQPFGIGIKGFYPTFPYFKLLSL